VFIDDDYQSGNPVTYELPVHPGGYMEVTPDPADVPAGLYYVAVAKTHAGHKSLWVHTLDVVEAGSDTDPLVVTNEEDESCEGPGTECAHPIVPGQTWQGEWGQAGDADYFTFVAGAGTQVHVTLDRADTSLPAQDPNAPAPQLLLARPDGVIVASGTLPPLEQTATSLDATLSMTGQHTIVAKTAKGSGQYILTLTRTAEAGAGSASFGYTRRRMFLTTQFQPEAQLLAPLVDPFGNPLSGANVSWARGTACQPEGFCETGQDGAYRSSLDGWANMRVTPGSGSQTLYRPWMAHPPAVGAQGQGARGATAPAAGGDPRLGYLDIDLDAVRGGDLPSPTEAVEMERWQRFEIAQRQRSAGGSADAAHVMAVLDGPGCSGAALTCGDDTPVFEPVRVDLGSGESLQDVTLSITDGTSPITELDGDTVLTAVPLTLEASVVIREPGGGTHEVTITDPVPVFVTPDTGAAIEDPPAGATCTELAIPPGPFVYHVGKHAGGSFTYIDQNGDACCWAATEELHATVVAAVEVDDGQGGTIAVTKRVETTVPSKPRPADACQARAYPQDAPEIAGFGPWDSTQETEQWQEVGAVYLTDACGNILHDLGKNDSPDHDQPGDEFHITGVTPDQGGEVYATAEMDQFQWLYHLKLHGAHDFGSDRVGIPEGIYQINLEIASTADCGDGAHIADAYTADYANGRPVMELQWDIGRGAEPTDLTASPEAALRDPATGDVAAWRVLPIDAGQVPEENHGATYTDVPVKLYVASVTKTFDENGNLVEDYKQVPGVELCTGEVHQLIDADHPWPGQVTATCAQTHPDEFTTTVSSDPAGAWTWGGTYDGPLGISVGLTKAPSEPGDYYLVAEPLDESFRRGQSWKVDHGIGWPKPVVRFTVMGGVFLDENWQRIADDIAVDQPRLIHLILNSGTGDTPPALHLDLREFGTQIDAVPFTPSVLADGAYGADFLLLRSDMTDPGGYDNATRVTVPGWWCSIDVVPDLQAPVFAAGTNAAASSQLPLASTTSFGMLSLAFVHLAPELEATNPMNFRVFLRRDTQASFDFPGGPETVGGVSPAQSSWGSIEVALTISPPMSDLERQNITLYLRADDPPDQSSYLPPGSAGDNIHPLSGPMAPRWDTRGGWISETELCPQPCIRLDSVTTISPFAVWNMSADPLNYYFFSGDNFQFHARLVGNGQPYSAERHSDTDSGVVTAWKVKWVKIGEMLKRGFLLDADASAGDATLTIRIPKSDYLSHEQAGLEFGCQNADADADPRVCEGTRPQVIVFDANTPFRVSQDTAYLGSMDFDDTTHTAVLTLKQTHDPADPIDYSVQGSYSKASFAGVSPFPVDRWRFEDVFPGVSAAFEDAYIKVVWVNAPVAERVILPHFHLNQTGAGTGHPPPEWDYPAMYPIITKYFGGGWNGDTKDHAAAIAVGGVIAGEGDIGEAGHSQSGNIVVLVDETEKAINSYPEVTLRRAEEEILAHELDHMIANISYIDENTDELLSFHCNETLEGRTDVQDPDTKGCAGFATLIIESLHDPRPRLGLGCLLNGFDVHNHLYAGRRSDIF